MRELVTKYDGECRECGAEIAKGARVVYERRVGVFCLTCAPTDPERIRAYREEAAERKAEKLEAWAEKREQRAASVLNPGDDHYSRDWAFITQPGHIPQRARWNAAVEREAESVAKAREMRAKAASLRSGVLVKGDTAARREAYRAPRREAVRAWIRKGQTVDTALFGPREVVRVNAKTVTVRGMLTTIGQSDYRIDLADVLGSGPVAAT